ncbi:MAG TPA: cyclopropane-fatty-acyl-phospholipid synthase family protein [Acidimicrobiales bacterium]|jgi:cyclopropane-fatty-acyl-phospholipid synthase|nr:cyclopropane-fatty-acyl-phospholipid synthase family protein [Acidimicrobiales bacterium]
MKPIARQLLPGLLSRTAAEGSGTLNLDGPGVPRPHRRTTGSGEPSVTVTVTDARTWSAILRHGSVGLADSYTQGWWTTDNLTDAVRIAFRRSAGYRSFLEAVARHGGRPLDALRSLRAPVKTTDRANIAAHYDLSNEFFALMLDPTMAYSCAYFAEADDSLEKAQLAKFDRLATKLRLGPDDDVVEIGTGWGGLAVHLAERYGCRVTTTTISQAQRDFAAKRVADLGLAHRVTVLGDHYRDLTGKYDALVSVEMIEAVDWRHHDDFFTCCANLLGTKGRMGLQAITIADGSFERAKHHDDFVRREVFPGSCLPSLAAIAGSVGRTSDLRIVDVEDIGPHYAETLRRWRQNVADNAGSVAQLGFDESFLRYWEMYLCYCEASFLERHVSDVQLVLARPAAEPVARVGEPLATARATP